jgi:hypothetical protein
MGLYSKHTRSHHAGAKNSDAKSGFYGKRAWAKRNAKKARRLEDKAEIKR